MNIATPTATQPAASPDLTTGFMRVPRAADSNDIAVPAEPGAVVSGSGLAFGDLFAAQLGKGSKTEALQIDLRSGPPTEPNEAVEADAGVAATATLQGLSPEAGTVERIARGDRLLADVVAPIPTTARSGAAAPLASAADRRSTGVDADTDPRSDPVGDDLAAQLALVSQWAGLAKPQVAEAAAPVTTAGPSSPVVATTPTAASAALDVAGGLPTRAAGAAASPMTSAGEVIAPTGAAASFDPATGVVPMSMPSSSSAASIEPASVVSASSTAATPVSAAIARAISGSPTTTSSNPASAPSNASSNASSIPLAAAPVVPADATGTTTPIDDQGKSESTRSAVAPKDDAIASRSVAVANATAIPTSTPAGDASAADVAPVLSATLASLVAPGGTDRGGRSSMTTLPSKPSLAAVGAGSAVPTLATPVAGATDNGLATTETTIATSTESTVPSTAFAVHLAATGPHTAAAPSDNVATPAAIVSAPVGTTAWSNEVGHAALRMAANDLQTASLRMSPEHLGPVDVQVRIDNGIAHLAFTAAHAETRQALEASRGTLEQLFADQGLRIGDCAVGDGSSARRDFGADATTGDFRSPRDADGRRPDVAAATTDTVGTTAVSRANRAVGLVDTFA